MKRGTPEVIRSITWSYLPSRSELILSSKVPWWRRLLRRKPYLPFKPNG